VESKLFTQGFTGLAAAHIGVTGSSFQIVGRLIRFFCKTLPYGLPVYVALLPLTPLGQTRLHLGRLAEKDFNGR
jgi:hypothetical protein